MRRLAIVCRQVDGVTGTTTTILEHTRRLAALGWEVHVYAERLDEGRIAAAGGSPRRVRGLPVVAGSFRRGFFAWRVERTLRRGRYDLVWGHGDGWTQDVLSLHNCVHAAHEAVRGAPLPARSGVGHMHGRILREQGFRLLIANSALMRDEVVRRFSVPAERTVVIHPGYDPARFGPDLEGHRARTRRDLGLGSDDLLVGLITSGDFAKRGVREFLASLSLLSARARSALKVLVIGQESRLGPYRRLAEGTGLTTRFLLPVPDVQRYYHALDLYVHPALYEEFGQSVQEAMACGVPVLASRRVGASELLGPLVPDMTVERPDPPALAAAMERLLLDKELRARWAEQGRRAVQSNTWDENFRRTHEALESLLRGPAPSRHA